MQLLAMHVPDGFIDAPVSLFAFVLAAAVLGVAVVRSRAALDDRTAPLAGLTAVFIFAAQMINFPVAAGTSGHLLGGALAAILVGPWAGMLVVTVVLVVQALLFADGGLTALGINVLNMAVVTAVVGWLVFRLGVRFVKTPKGAALVAGVAAFLSVPASALAFVAEYALGGTAPVSLAAVAAAMGGVHVLIGIGEGIITGLVVAAVLASRPDIVAGVQGTALARPVRRTEAVPA
ncbi:MAG: energy-coupling factor ABC transporter permease [Candidatus Nanopelagicales bacterium]